MTPLIALTSCRPNAAGRVELSTATDPARQALFDGLVARAAGRSAS